MRFFRLPLAIWTAAVFLNAPCYAQFPPNPDATGPSEGAESQGGSGSSSSSSSADTAPEKNEPPDMGPTELDYPVDEKIKVKVDPFTASPVVDRISEPCTVTVEGQNILDVEVFVVPVDGPYGGHAIDRPRSIGKDLNPAKGFTVKWTGKEQSQYVKVFAVVHKRVGIPRQVRSPSLDFGMDGARFEAPAKP
jgi:hypothetical protein